MSNNNNQYGGNNPNAWGYGAPSKLESFNNFDNIIDQTPKKVYQSFPLGMNSSHLVNDKENSFIKPHPDNQHDVNGNDHYQNNYQIPSHYPYNQNYHHSMDPYNYQYQNYGFYYPQQPQQPYYGYDYNNGNYNQNYYDQQQGYQPHHYNNNNYYFNKTPPLTGQKVQQNIIVQKSENKFTGLQNQNGVDEAGNKKEVTDFSLNALVQQVNISEFLPGDNQDMNNSNNQQVKQNQNLSTPQNTQLNLTRLKSTMSKSSMDQESEQYDDSTKKSKITPSKRIQKKKQKSARQTPQGQQDNEDNFSNKTEATLKQNLINASNNFNKSMNYSRNCASEQTSEQIIPEEDYNNMQNEQECYKNVKQPPRHHSSQNSGLKKQKSAQPSFFSNVNKVNDENNNLNLLNVNVQNNTQSNNLNFSRKIENDSRIVVENDNRQNYEKIDFENDDDEDDSDENEDLNQTQKKLADQKQSSDDSSNDKNQSDAKPCNCRNSKCLKRYCDCFAAGLYCQSECKCEECHNKPEYEDERQKAIQKKKKRIKDAFQPVIQNNTHIKGCHCKNSHCLKKYCVCHQNGVMCSSLCQCVECENKIEAMKKEPQNQQPQLQKQVSQQYMTQQFAKENNMNLMNNPNIMNNNMFAQQHLQSPYNNSSVNHDHTDVEFPSTIKKDSLASKNKGYEEDYSTHKKPAKRKAFKSNEKQKALSFYNEISPADNKYVINKS